MTTHVSVAEHTFTLDLGGAAARHRVRPYPRRALPWGAARRALAACRETGRITAIVSNNSERAVQTYLTRHGLADRTGPVFARASYDPALLKPNPHLIEKAVQSLGAKPAATSLVGDSITDVEGSHLAGVNSIGYANKPGKRNSMIAVGADAVIETLSDLALKIRSYAGRKIPGENT